MTGSRILALIALAAFVLFFGIILRFVPRIDLTIAVAVGLLLAGYDLWTQLGRRRSR